MSYGVSLSGMVARQSIKSRAQLYKVSVLAVVFCFTVALGNVSLRFIPVSFNQAIGATTPAFTALLNVAMAHQGETQVGVQAGAGAAARARCVLWQRTAMCSAAVATGSSAADVWSKRPAVAAAQEVYLSLVPVVVGIIIASGAEPSFQLFGFTAAVAATAARAFKSGGCRGERPGWRAVQGVLGGGQRKAKCHMQSLNRWGTASRRNISAEPQFLHARTGGSRHGPHPPARGSPAHPPRTHCCAVLQGMMLSDPNEKLDSMNLLMYMAPVAVLALIPMTLLFEREALSAAIELGATSAGGPNWDRGGWGGGV